MCNDFEPGVSCYLERFDNILNGVTTVREIIDGVIDDLNADFFADYNRTATFVLHVVCLHQSGFVSIVRPTLRTSLVSA